MKDLLDGVNEVLVRVNEVESASKLTSLTDSSRQVFIDNAIAAWNDVIDELYTLAQCSRPDSIKAKTITLVENQREYRLHSTLVTLRREYHLIDETNNHIISLVEDGHRSIIFGDIEQDDTGTPAYAALSPENGKLILDVAPDAESAGRVYKYRFEYEKELNEATDLFPFNDTVFRALIDAVTEKWKFDNRAGAGSAEVYNKSLARAAYRLSQMPWRKSWAPVHTVHADADPFVSA